MGKKTKALQSIEAALKELQEMETKPVDFDPVLSFAEKTVVVAGVAALVVIAAALAEMAWLWSHPEDPTWTDAWEGGGGRAGRRSDLGDRDGQSASGNRGRESAFD